MGTVDYTSVTSDTPTGIASDSTFDVFSLDEGQLLTEPLFEFVDALGNVNTDLLRDYEADATEK